MLICVAIAFLIFTFIFIIHGQSHFQLNLCGYSNSNIKCHCAVIPISGELNFFPKSWHQYIAFHIMTCIIMVATELINDYLQEKKWTANLQLLFEFIDLDSIDMNHNNEL
eukprot:298372_1